MGYRRYGNDEGYGGYGFPPYVPVAVRRARAAREMQKLAKKGVPISPVKIEGREIASTFWGKAWCQNLERYSDFENRLPRGRTYVRNGSVVDLQVTGGKVSARVSGSEIYRVTVTVAKVAKAHWDSLCRECAGGIDSLVELLSGEFSDGVMERICQQETGLFPAPAHIKFSCSCPDVATMCKHVAAVLYGIGARFDREPSHLFRLRGVNENDLIAHAGDGIALAKNGPASSKVLADSAIADVFGIELAGANPAPAPAAVPTPKARKTSKPRGKKKTVTVKPSSSVSANTAARVRASEGVTKPKRRTNRPTP
jgi:uncharacterized Zn finger protein